MAELHIIWQNSTRTKVSKEAIEGHLTSVLRHLKRVDKVEVELSLMTDKEIRALKQRFFGRNESTDVLSFPGDSVANVLTGSIAISIETAAKQAKQAGIELIDELKMLSSHGLLHLLGYHHR